MGSDLSANICATLEMATEQELEDALAGLQDTDRKKLAQALSSGVQSANVVQMEPRRYSREWLWSKAAQSSQSPEHTSKNKNTNANANTNNLCHRVQQKIGKAESIFSHRASIDDLQGIGNQFNARLEAMLEEARNKQHQSVHRIGSTLDARDETEDGDIGYVSAHQSLMPSARSENPWG